MAVNEFSKEEVVLFDRQLAGFDDGLAFLDRVNIFKTDATTMERTNSIIWRPQPYIMTSEVGYDQSANYKNVTQLSVPATIGEPYSSPWLMTTQEMNDAMQEGRIFDAAKQRITSQINLEMMRTASYQGSLVVPVTGAAGSYDDIALCDSIMNERGVPGGAMNRTLALSTRDYNGLAADIVGSARSFTRKGEEAYSRGWIGDDVAGFGAYKLDTNLRITAAAGGATLIDTQASAGNYYVPAATSVAVTGQSSNVDNRWQTITVDNTAGVAVGDAFSIDGVYAVHNITKESTGQLLTHRVMQVLSATQLVISSPIISNQGGTEAEAQYQNCVVTPSATAAFNWLNDNATAINCFWHRDALEILPGTFTPPTNSGVAVMRTTTKRGLSVTMQKQYDSTTSKIFLRTDVRVGFVCTNPEMAGILLFNQ